MQARIFIRDSPTCPQIKHRMLIMRDSALLRPSKHRGPTYDANRSAASQNGTSGPQMIARTRALKQRAIRNAIGSFVVSQQATTAGVSRSSDV